jgi:methylglyoxal synthase
MRIALIAHDRMKDRMVALATEFAPLLKQHTLLGTGTTGGRLQDEVGLNVSVCSAGHSGATCRLVPACPWAKSMPWCSCATP